MINKIKIKKYRSFENTEIEFVNGINLIVGKNGVGKTNLLEAIREGLANSNKEIEVFLEGNETPIVLDEPERLPEAKQIIFTTHNDKLIAIANRIINISLEDGKSEVCVLKN